MATEDVTELESMMPTTLITLLWEKFTGVLIQMALRTFINCIAGYVTNPYPPFQDQYITPASSK